MGATWRAVLGLLLVVIGAGCVAPAEPEVTCIGFTSAECDDVWRAFVERNNRPATDAHGRNRVTEVRVERTACSAAIDVRFADGTGLATAGGLC